MNIRELRIVIAGMGLPDEMRVMQIAPQTEHVLASLMSLPVDQQRVMLSFAHKLYGLNGRNDLICD